MEHAKYSPSKLNGWASCPHFERIDTNDSEQGSRLHKVLETGDDLLIETEEEKEWVKFCRAYVDTTKIKIDAPSWQVDNTSKIYIEHKIPSPFDECWGHIDRLQFLHDGSHADLFDWKFVRKPVPKIPQNFQLKAYALGVFYSFRKVESVTAHIVCPILGETEAHTFQRSDYDRLKLEIWGVIKRREAATQDGCAKHTLNLDYCSCCSVTGNCPRIAEVVAKALPKYENISWALQKHFPHPRGIGNDAELVAIALKLKPIMENWCKAVAQLGKDLFEFGYDIPGFTIRKGKSAGKVLDESKIRQLALTFGLTEADLSSMSKLKTALLWRKLGKDKDAFLEELVQLKGYQMGREYEYPVLKK